ncbi:MAG TPA: hypothetical protein VGR72_09320 [Candidatus Acidoferrales bacterium]|nr:hypothetical protein [Candidatus Acidoferrales bacterium]
MDAFPRALLDIIIAVPFVAAGLLFVFAVRAVIRGHLITKGRFLQARTILRSAQPFQFWTEVALYCLCGAFLLLMGLMWVGHDPRWFHQMMLGTPNAARAPRH